jgi:hypothetical protein
VSARTSFLRLNGENSRGKVQNVRGDSWAVHNVRTYSSAIPNATSRTRTTDGLMDSTSSANNNLPSPALLAKARSAKG